MEVFDLLLTSSERLEMAAECYAYVGSTPESSLYYNGTDGSGDKHGA